MKKKEWRRKREREKERKWEREEDHPECRDASIKHPEMKDLVRFDALEILHFVQNDELLPPLHFKRYPMAVHHAILLEEVKELNPALRIAVLAAEFNAEIMDPLIAKNLELFQENGFTNVDLFRVPWCFELPGMAQTILESGIYNVVIVLWCVVRGQTPHFDYVCTECSRGIMDLSMSYETPIVFGVLTCDTMEQAQARVDNNYGIYALNYLVQSWVAEARLEQRYEELKEEMNAVMESMNEEEIL